VKDVIIITEEKNGHGFMRYQLTTPHSDENSIECFRISLRIKTTAVSGVAMGCAGCAKHKGPMVQGPLSGASSGISVLRSYTECTMSAERLSNLAMLPIENECAKKLVISKLVDIFAQEKAGKRTF
jgi:hypothetical protein